VHQHFPTQATPMSDYGSYGYRKPPDFEKDPDSTLDYLFNWNAELNGDTISDSEFLLPDGMTEVSTDFTDTTATIFVTGGNCGSNYRVTNRITTDGGRTLDQTITIAVRSQ
jgi:hypothetical protein